MTWLWLVLGWLAGVGCVWALCRSAALGDQAMAASREEETCEG